MGSYAIIAERRWVQLNFPRVLTVCPGAWRVIEQFNETRSNRDFILKIGVHRRASIAVTLSDRLDYFGQTVNIASRVQHLAEGDEICLTRDVFSSTGVTSLLLP
jgi:class 3 adenylate cyclase